ncbi:MAG: hypothetical protein ACYC61_11630 [Isosphaeraceae bacterium]
MRPVENTSERLVLAGPSLLFRPFFAGGLALLAVGLGLLIVAAAGGPADNSARPAGEPSATVAGLGVFLTTFGLFVAILPLIGRFPYRREIIVDCANRQVSRRDRTLVRLRQDAYPFRAIVAVRVDEAWHPDGDPYYTLVFELDSGEVLTLERFTDRRPAAEAAGLIRDRLDAAREEPASAPAP